MGQWKRVLGAASAFGFALAVTFHPALAAPPAGSSAKKKTAGELFDEALSGKAPAKNTARSTAVKKVVEESNDEENASDAKNAADKAKFPTTHKQSRVIAVKHNGGPINLNTFCLAPNGDILACVGGDHTRFVPNASGDFDSKDEKNPALIQVYSPEGTLRTAYKVGFKPTAINVLPNGEIVVAGQGKIARLASDGKLIKQGWAPNVGDYEAFKKEAVAAAKKESEQYTKQFRDQIKTYEEQISQIEKTPEKDRTAAQNSRIRALTSAKKTQEQFCDQMEKQAGAADSDAAVLNRLTITALGATAKDLFVSCRAKSGHGYEVWRCNHDFGDAESLVSGLSGCCGQLDIQAMGDKLYVAENGRFQVSTYDREGEKLSKFGKRDASAVDGFGSCCNPMNMRCCSSGELLVAESSIGNIKRFSADGKLLAFVGKAKITGGCKHVAIGWDEKRDWYYMMHVDKDHICVLVPNAQATDTDDEKAARTAREGLGKKLAGTSWVKPSAASKSAAAAKTVKKPAGKTSAKTEANAEAEADEVAITTSIFSSGRSQMFESIAFNANGTIASKGGSYAATVNSTKWEPVRQTDDTLDVQLTLDGAEYYSFRIKFLAGDRIELTMLYDENAMGRETYQLETARKTTARK